MAVKVVVLLVYVAGLFVIGWYARTRWSEPAEGFFLAHRSLGTVIFLASFAATNFSAFTVIGVSGEGYREGYAFYPIIGFGTGFMAITIWGIGRRVRELGQEMGALTPPDLVRSVYDHRGVSTLVAVIMVVFTLPYIALQPIAAGYALQELLGMPYFLGAVLTTGVIVLYTLRGGLKAVAWTDAFQGLVMIVVLLLAAVVVADQAGGLVTAGKKLLAEHPALFSRPGELGQYLPGIWLSYIALWFFCDPMFPQLFQRFLAAQDNRPIRRTMLAYPFICTVLFILPTTIGVLGRLSHPGLERKAADHILPILAADMGSPLLGALIVACVLAALMSTMSSQLLTLSAMVAHDLVPLFRKNRPTTGAEGRFGVLILALIGLALAVQPPGTILDIAVKYAFTGLAVVFPTVLFGLYPGWRSARGAIVSLVVGEGALVLTFFGLLPKFGFLPVIPILVLTFGSYLLVAAAERLRAGAPLPWPRAFLSSPYAWALLAIFVLAMDFWRWGQVPSLVFGWPSWIFYFVLLSAAQTVVMALWSRERGK